MFLKLINVTPLEDYKLLIEYENFEKQIFDVKPYISGSWYGMLSDKNFFKTVHISGKRSNGLTDRILHLMSCMNYLSERKTIYSKSKKVVTK